MINIHSCFLYWQPHFHWITVWLTCWKTLNRAHISRESQREKKYEYFSSVLCLCSIKTNSHQTHHPISEKKKKNSRLLRHAMVVCSFVKNETRAYIKFEFFCRMQQYHVAWQTCGINQPPNIGWYIGNNEDASTRLSSRHNGLYSLERHNVLVDHEP